MPYPTTEQYMEALQFPSKHLKDVELANAKVESTGMGLPFARSGGFALTFKLIGPGKSWALRLFQKDRVGDKLGERYGAISRGIKSCGLPYFVDFSFLPAGISIQTQTYSCVKMGWAEGTVLGTYIEKNKKNKSILLQLRQNIQKMAADMERVGFAHGDFQTDNLLVSASGGLKFVDYDAFFVPEIAGLGAIEVGYPNFQHPERGKLKPFDNKMDRFSYLVIDSALNALISNPDLWDKVSADPQGLLVRASDFASPQTSMAFCNTLAQDPQVGNVYQRLAAVCEGKYADIPLLSDFIAGKGPAALNLRPISTLSLNSTTRNVTAASGATYQSVASRVISGDNFLAAKGAEGQFVEIVGLIKNVDVRPNWKNKRPKTFLIFGTVSGNSVYIPIWEDGLIALSNAGKTVGIQNKGQWVSVVGMMDAAYATSSWSRTGITVKDASQINFISEAEAKLRLTSKSVTPSSSFTPSTPAQATALNPAARNAQIAAQAKAAASKSSPSSSSYKKTPAPRKTPARNSYSSSSTPSYPSRPKSTTSEWGCGPWIAIGIGVLILINIVGSLFNGG